MKRIKIPLIILFAGVVCMILGNFIQNQNAKVQTYTEPTNVNGHPVSSGVHDGATYATVTDWRVIIEYHQNRIVDFLKNVKGVGSVSVLVYCDRSSVLELVSNSVLDDQFIEENDGNGGTRDTQNHKQENEYLVIQDQDGNQRVVAVSESIPAITSVCVVCSGGDQAAVQERIITALSALYNLSANKIVVIQGI